MQIQVPFWYLFSGVLELKVTLHEENLLMFSPWFSTESYNSEMATEEGSCQI